MMKYEITTRSNKIVVVSMTCQAKDDHYSQLYMALCHVVLSRRKFSFTDRPAFQSRFNVNVFGVLSSRFQCESFAVTLKEDVIHTSGSTYQYKYEVTLERSSTEPSQQELQLILAEARHLCGISKRRFVLTDNLPDGAW